MEKEKPDTMEATFAEIIQTINCSQITSLDDLSDEDRIPPAYPKQRFRMFYDRIERWMGALYPDTVLNQQRIVDEDFDGDPNAVYMNLCFDALRFGFALGYLGGCQSMGADSKALTMKATGFMTNLEREARQRTCSRGPAIPMDEQEIRTRTMPYVKHLRAETRKRVLDAAIDRLRKTLRVIQGGKKDRAATQMPE